MTKKFAPDSTLWEQILACWLLSSIVLVPIALIVTGWVYALEHAALAVVSCVLLIKTTPARARVKTRIRGSLTVTDAFFHTGEALDADEFVNGTRAFVRKLDTTKRPHIRQMDRWLSKAFLPYAQSLPGAIWGECALDIEDSSITVHFNGTFSQTRMEVVLRFTLYFANDAGAVAFMLQHGDCGTVEFETETTKKRKR
jgi:hypothetical protein